MTLLNNAVVTINTQSGTLDKYGKATSSTSISYNAFWTETIDEEDIKRITQIDKDLISKVTAKCQINNIFENSINKEKSTLTKDSVKYSIEIIDFQNTFIGSVIILYVSEGTNYDI